MNTTTADENQGIVWRLRSIVEALEGANTILDDLSGRPLDELDEKEDSIRKAPVTIMEELSCAVLDASHEARILVDRLMQLRQDLG